MNATYRMLFSFYPDRRDPLPLQGRVISQKPFYAFLEDRPELESVVFYLDDPENGTTQSEQNAPWDALGSISNSTARPFAPAFDGFQRALTAEMTRTGASTIRFCTNFTIDAVH